MIWNTMGYVLSYSNIVIKATLTGFATQTVSQSQRSWPSRGGYKQTSLFKNVLGNKTTTHLRVFFVIVLLSSDPSPNQLVTDSISESKIIISVSRNISVLHQCVMKVSVKRFLQVCNISNLGYASHTYLTAAVDVSLWLRHPASDSLCKMNVFCRFSRQDLRRRSSAFLLAQRLTAAAKRMRAKYPNDLDILALGVQNG